MKRQIVLENSLQAAYRQAKREHERLMQIVGEELNPILDASNLDTDEGIEAYCEQEAQVHIKYNTLQAGLTLREAEDALLAWGHNVARRDSRYSRNRDILEQLFATKNLHYRQRAIDLCLRLDPEA